MLTQEKLNEYRKLAENTMMVSALGEYTPQEFIELLDHIQELEGKIDLLRSAIVETSNLLTTTVLKSLKIDTLEDAFINNKTFVDVSIKLHKEIFTPVMEQTITEG